MCVSFVFCKYILFCQSHGAVGLTMQIKGGLTLVYCKSQANCVYFFRLPQRISTLSPSCHRFLKCRVITYACARMCTVHVTCMIGWFTAFKQNKNMCKTVNLL